MRMHPREFPSGRRRRPKRQAERRVYEALAGSDRRGFCYYEWRRGYESLELDFAVWIEALGRFALQVKGGPHLLIDGEWHRRTPAGVQPVRSSPLDEAWLAALDLHDDIEALAETAHNPFVIPVLLFPDMDPDPDIQSLAKRKGVYVTWGTEDLLNDLERIARSRRVSDPLPAERIAREVWAVTDGLVRLGQTDDAAADGGDEGEARVSGRRLPAVLRLVVGGTTVLAVRSSAVRRRLGKRHPTGRRLEG